MLEVSYEPDYYRWAKREVELAKKRERDGGPIEWEYGCACYDSALKAFRSLCDDNHSGASIVFTKHILNRLIDRKPLTPIIDEPDEWSDDVLDYSKESGHVSYQNKRMSSLFKNVYTNGRVEYDDIERFITIDLNSNCQYRSSLCTSIGAEIYHITMPYMPEDKPYRVYVEECLAYPDNGDFDTVAVLNIVTPAGENRAVHRYFREPYNDEKCTYKGWVEIDVEEYERRVQMEKEREEREQQQIKNGKEGI